jgi:hypothetical protein
MSRRVGNVVVVPVSKREVGGPIRTGDRSGESVECYPWCCVHNGWLQNLFFPG